MASEGVVQPQPSAPQALALVIVWSAREPQRIGEVALFPTEERLWVLGRNPQCPAPGTQLRMRGRPVSFHRQRPDGVPRRQVEEEGEVLAGEGISRRQIELNVQKDALHVKNIGRCPLRINGVSVSEGILRPRDTLYLQNQIMFYCCWRPLDIAPLIAYPIERAAHFGEPDQDGIIGESPAIWELRERLALSAGMHCPVVIKGACRVVRGQAERALSALVADAALAPSAAKPPRSSAAASKIDTAKRIAQRLDSPAEQDVPLGVAVTAPRFQEVEVPGLNERPEDIPLILHQLLRQHAYDEEIDLSPYFYMGLPRVHPSMIETLLHQHYTGHVAQLSELAQQALNHKADAAPHPRPSSGKARRAKGLTSSSRKTSPPSEPPLMNSLAGKTLAMLQREGVPIPNEWESRSLSTRGSRSGRT